MSGLASEAAPFYPPSVKPSARPLRFPSNLIKLLGNNLEAIPEQAYREPLVIAPGPPRMAFFTGTEVSARRSVAPALLASLVLLAVTPPLLWPLSRPLFSLRSVL